MLGETGSIGGDKFKKYQKTSNWFEDMFTPASGRVSLTPEYQEGLNMKKFGKGVQDNPWMTAEKPSVLGPLQTDYGTFEGGAPMTEEDWDFFHGQDVLDQGGQDRFGKFQKNAADFLGLTESEAGGAGVGAKLFDNINPKDLIKGMIGGGPGITKYNFGARGGKGVGGGMGINKYSGGNITGATPPTSNITAAASGTTGGFTEGAKQLFSKAGDLAGKVSGPLGLATGGHSLASRDYSSALSAGSTGSKAASTAGDIAGMVTVATGGASAPITVPLQMLFGGLSTV